MPDASDKQGKLLRSLRAVRQAFGTPSALTLFFLGFGCGLPFPLLAGTASAWMRDKGVSLGLIGLVSYATLTFTFKFVWAPVVDRYGLPGFSRLGRRRGWLLFAQLVLLVGLLGMALTGPGEVMAPFVGFMALAALAAATQDTVVDAYRIEVAPQEAQAALASTYTLGYRLALIAGGAGALYLAEAAAWRPAYLILTLLLILPVGATLLGREPTGERRERPSFGVAFVKPFEEFFSRSGTKLAFALLLFVGLFKLPDQMLGVLANPFYLDVGFTKAEIATVSKVYGVWIGIFGAFLGGVAVPALGMRLSMVIAAVTVAFSNLLFILMSIYPAELWAFVLTIFGDNLSQGFAGTILVAFMSGLTHREHTATQYALLSSLANLPGKLVGGVSGFIVERWSYTSFFVMSAVSIVPTLVLIAYLWRVPSVFPQRGEALPRGASA